MSNSCICSHLREIFRWSTDGKARKAEMLAAALGMAVPLLVAQIAKHPAPGFAAALGALAVGRVEGPGFLAYGKGVLEALAPTLLAALLALGVGGHGWWTSAVVVVLAGAAATIGGFSRPMVAAATRFVLFLMIVAATPAQPPLEAAAFLAFVAVGAFWTSTLGLAFGAAAAASREASVGATARQKYARWTRSLGTLAGWSYPVRLMLGLAVAAALDLLWPDRHLHWIGLTVAIITPRRTEFMPAKTTQRALGTALGVGATGIALCSELSSWVLALAIGLLAGARPALRRTNYLAYSAVMTPLVVLIVDGGAAPESGLLLDRLMATLLGAALVVVANLAMAELDPPFSGPV